MMRAWSFRSVPNATSRSRRADSRGPAASLLLERAAGRRRIAARRRRAGAARAARRSPAQTIFRGARRRSTDSQVLQAIARGALASPAPSSVLGREARVEFAWRCAKIGEAMLDAMDRYFPEVR